MHNWYRRGGSCAGGAAWEGDSVPGERKLSQCGCTNPETGGADGALYPGQATIHGCGATGRIGRGARACGA
eukprot:5941397-Prorocentrum_lima.AAC.1